MPSEYAFHIRNAHPGDMVAALAALEASPDLNTIAEVVDYAETLGFAIRDRTRLEALATARDLHFVEANANVLTDKGNAVSQLELNKPDLFPDIVHGCQYALWTKETPQLYCFSWTYREICKFLWRQRNFNVDSQSKKEIASEIEGLARLQFGRSDISLSTKSVGGAFLWLEELTPNVIDHTSGQFARRTFCPPELLVLGIDVVYRMEEMDYGVNLLLSDEQRDAICQVCLLEPEGFDRVLEYATSQFDYLDKGIGGGWGRYLTLYKSPTMDDFI